MLFPSVQLIHNNYCNKDKLINKALKEEGQLFAIYVTICSRIVTAFKKIFISVLSLLY